MGQQSPSQSRGSSPGSPTSGARSRASTDSSPLPNISAHSWPWIRPLSDDPQYKSPFKDAHLYRQENHFRGELTTAVGESEKYECSCTQLGREVVHERLKRLDIERPRELLSLWSADSGVKMEARRRRTLVGRRQASE